MINLSETDFIKLSEFIQKEFGINMTKKKELLSSRIMQIIREFKYDSLEAYVEYILEKPTTKDLEILLNAVTTNYTYFMRENEHFQYFKEEVLPQLVKRKDDNTLNIWCAGCSTGQEAYTISMILKDYFANSSTKWDTRILATDISSEVLDIAKEGIYDESSIKEMSDNWVDKYFDKIGNGNYQANKELRNNISFRIFNLMDDIKFKVKFDVIFCRNVMIYFSKETKSALVRRFYDASVKEGYLFVGQSENISN